MSDPRPEEAAALLRVLIDQARRDAAGRDAAWQKLENAGLINRVKVQEYRCRDGCVLAVVIRLGDVALMRTRDYKLRPRTNNRRSVASAREKNTLNGSDHWPSYTFNVGESAGLSDPAQWGSEVWGDHFHADINCRHRLRSIDFVQVLADIRHTSPGHPRKPSIIP